MKFSLKSHGAVRAFLKLPVERTNYAKKMAVITLYDRLCRQAPVLTGRYRQGFNCTINNIDYGVPDPAPYIPYVKYKQLLYTLDEERAIKAFASVKIDDNVIISNALPYAEPIENGHSQQAPNGVFRVVFPQVERDVKWWATVAKNMDGGFEHVYGKSSN